MVALGCAAEHASSRLDAAGALRWSRELSAELGGQAGRVLCAAAFSPGSVSGVWGSFPALRLVLPRWLYTAGGGHASLTLALESSELSQAGCRRAVNELGDLWGALSRPARPSRPRRAVVRQLPARRWHALAGAALGEIASRKFRKLVPARMATARIEGRWDAAAVLQALSREPGCTAFAFRCGQAVFLGATPERLIARKGRAIRTEALAGTAARGSGPVDLRTAKSSTEHDLVVREISRRLGPLCSSLSVRSRPEVRSFADMLHLRTAIEGRLRADTHVLELGLRLHPTPAVSGLPVRRAVRWLEAHEEEPRGWYAGFVGWFDGRGDGDLSVAIRSGLLLGSEARLFTGAGVVAGSTAPSEYAETALKQRPFLRALGLAP